MPGGGPSSRVGVGTRGGAGVNRPVLWRPPALQAPRYPPPMAVTARWRGTANSEPNSTRGHVAASAHRGGGRGGERDIGGFLRSGTSLAQSMLPRGQPEIPGATVMSVCCGNMAWIRAAQPRKYFCRILTPDFLEVFRFSHDQRRKK